MTFYHFILRLLDFGSFSSIWYWIVLIGLWIANDRKVLGVSTALVFRARRHGEDSQTAQDLRQIMAMRLREMGYEAAERSIWSVARNWCLGTMLVLFSFGFDLELAQAILLMIAPLMWVRMRGRKLAGKLAGMDLAAVNLPKILIWHRFRMQIFGMICLFITMLLGLIHTVNTSWY